MLMTYIIRSINIVPERICIAHALKNKVLPRQLIHYFMYIYKLYVLLNYSVHTTLFLLPLLSLERPRYTRHCERTGKIITKSV